MRVAVQLDLSDDCEQTNYRFEEEATAQDRDPAQEGADNPEKGSATCAVTEGQSTDGYDYNGQTEGHAEGGIPCHYVWDQGEESAVSRLQYSHDQYQLRGPDVWGRTRDEGSSISSAPAECGSPLSRSLGPDCGVQ